MLTAEQVDLIKVNYLKANEYNKSCHVRELLFLQAVETDEVMMASSENIFKVRYTKKGYTTSPQYLYLYTCIFFDTRIPSCTTLYNNSYPAEILLFFPFSYSAIN
jgi:hypothetical protein